MRTLTLGVLIVAGGTLAALPFRRYQAIPDASSAPAQVTGPMQSVLESPQETSIAAHDRSSLPADPLATHAYRSSRPAYDSSEHRRNVMQRRPRRADIPLSYADLEVPIDQPDPFKQRFNAIASIRAETLKQEAEAGFVMPAMESLAATQIDQIKTAAEQYDDGSAGLGNVNGSLASARQSMDEPLPAANHGNTDRGPTRHWIRQPD